MRKVPASPATGSGWPRATPYNSTALKHSGCKPRTRVYIRKLFTYPATPGLLVHRPTP